jgi:hypothetical protein
MPLVTRDNSSILLIVSHQISLQAKQSCLQNDSYYSISISIYFSSQKSLQNDIGHVIKGKFAGKRRREREKEGKHIITLE